MDVNLPKNETEKKDNLLKTIKDYVETVIVCVGTFAFITFGFDKSLIMSGSMEPTLMTGDTVIFTSFQSPKKGDIIEFKYDDERLSKRVIGVPGDVISFSDDGQLIVNGEKINEPYIKTPNSTFPALKDSYTIPEGKLFVLGDNRLDSCDSRFWENPYINKSDVIGKYLFTLSHSNK